MKLKAPLTGILAFLIVLLTMPLGHTTMIVMENVLGHEYVFKTAIAMGFIGLLLLIIGSLIENDTKATMAGLFSGLFIWTGWIEFAFVYVARRNGIAPLIENGEVVTKPEYLLMPSSIGFLAVLIIFNLFNTKSGCKFFNWIQKKLSIRGRIHEVSPIRNTALVTVLELITILWTFYLVLLLAYDKEIFGDKHPVTYIVAFGSLLWSVWLFMRLIKIGPLGYAIRYAIPTVIIFWNFVEILGRWNLLNEIWLQPSKYWLEMTLLTLVFAALVVVSVLERKRKLMRTGTS